MAQIKKIKKLGLKRETIKGIKGLNIKTTSKVKVDGITEMNIESCKKRQRN